MPLEINSCYVHDKTGHAAFHSKSQNQQTTLSEDVLCRAPHVSPHASPTVLPRTRSCRGGSPHAAVSGAPRNTLGLFHLLQVYKANEHLEASEKGDGGGHSPRTLEKFCEHWLRCRLPSESPRSSPLALALPTQLPAHQRRPRSRHQLVRHRAWPGPGGQRRSERTEEYNAHLPLAHRSVFLRER